MAGAEAHGRHAAPGKVWGKCRFSGRWPKPGLPSCKTGITLHTSLYAEPTTLRSGSSASSRSPQTMQKLCHMIRRSPRVAQWGARGDAA